MLREIDDRCAVGSHFLCSEQGKGYRDAGQERLYIKREKRAMYTPESLWTFSFPYRGLQPKWFLATAESNKSLHG